MPPLHLARAKRFLPAALLVMATIAAYHGVLGHGFLTNWDDADYVTNNQLIRGLSREHLSAIFSRAFLGNYAPLHILSYMLDFALWGLDPRGFHLTNLVLHVCSGLLLYFLAIRLELNRPVAVAGALIFLLHPVQVETVAWVSQRKNLLAMVFFLAAMHCHVSYAKCAGRSRRSWYLLSLGAFSLSLLCKSVAVVLPLVLILYDLCFRTDKGSVPRLLAEKLPFLLLALIASLVAVATQAPAAHGGRIEVDAASHLQIMLTMVTVLKKYLLLVFWPAQLNIVYTIPLEEAATPGFLAGAALLTGIIAAGLLLARKAPRMFFWYCLFFIGLLPVSQIVPLITLMNDRYLYFPMAGLSVFAAAGTAYLLGRTRTGNVPFVALMLLLAATLGFAAHERVQVWRNTLVLWKDSAEKSPESATSWSGLGNAFEMEGRNREALAAYERALALNPEDKGALVFASLLYQNMGMLTESQTLALRLVRRYPRNVDGWLTIGENFAKSAETEKAKAAFLKVLEIEPGNLNAEEWLAWLNRSNETGEHPNPSTARHQGRRP